MNRKKGCLRQPCAVCVATAAELLAETLSTPGHEV
jgi:bacterioferritin-associated ferredoxin